ncbi:MAG: AsmA family protein, partial [bacterium]
MNSNVKRIGLVVAGILGVLVAVYGVAALIVNFLVDPETLSDWVEPRMEAALNRPVDLEGARVRIFPTLAAELRRVEVGNLPDFEGPPLARVEGVRLEVAILPLFRGRVRVDEVRVDDPRVHLVVNDQRVSNYGDLVPEAREVEPAEEGSPLELAVREIRVRGADLTYESLPDTVRFELVGLEADASVERAATAGEWTGEARAGSERVALSHPALGSDPLVLDGPGLRAAASAGEEFDWVEIRDGAVILGGAELAMSGRMEDLKEPARAVDLALESESLSIPGIFQLIPDSAAAAIPGRGTGTLAVDLRVRGTVGPEERPLVRGRIRLQDVGFVDRSDRILAQDIGGVLDVREDALAVQGVRGSALGGPFGVDGTLSPDSVLSFQLSVTARPDLVQAAVLANLPEETELAGTVGADLELAGTGREPYRTTLDGRVDAVGIRFAQPRMGVPLAVDSARVSFTGDRASWQDVVLALGEDRLTVSGSVVGPLGVLGPEGEVVPRLDADVSGTRLDLDRLLPARGDTTVTYGQLAFARMGGRALRGRTAED